MDEVERIVSIEQQIAKQDEIKNKNKNRKSNKYINKINKLRS